MASQKLQDNSWPFDDGGKSAVIAKGVPGTALTATHDGAFYVLGPGQAWRISAKGAVSAFDLGLRNPTGGRGFHRRLAAPCVGWRFTLGLSFRNWRERRARQPGVVLSSGGPVPR